MSLARYYKFSIFLLATFMSWVILGFTLSIMVPIFGVSSNNFFSKVVSSNYSITFFISLAIYYYHRKVFKKDIIPKKDVGHFMSLAMAVFVPLFIYMLSLSLCEQLIRGGLLSLTSIGDTFRFSFSVIVPVYFLTLLFVGLIFTALSAAVRKLTNLNKS